jgi:hypothetical protein
MYSCTLSLTSVLDVVGLQQHAPSALSPGKGQCTHCTGGCVGPREGLEGGGGTWNVTQISEQKVSGSKFKFGTSKGQKSAKIGG